MTTGTTTEQIPANSTAQNSRNTLRTIYKKRRSVWIVLALVVFGVSLMIGLFLFPQSYSAMTSMSLSQPSGGSSQLALLTGGSSGKAKYIGPLKSWHFAEQVEKVVHLKELYQMQDEDEAIEKLQRNIRFDDNTTDGLLYITMTLDAPAKMAANSADKRKRIENTVALVANAYAQALKDYIAYNDTDKDLVLVRAAGGQLQQARANYDAAVEKWIGFVRDSKTTSLGMSASSSSQSPELAALQSLFIKRGQLEVQIRSTDAAIRGAIGLIDKPNTQIGKLPTEDQLLTEARRRYTEAQRDVQDLLIQYSDHAPPVLRAKERLKIAADHLHDQAEAILHGNTSENVKRQALDTEYATVVAQIAEAERTIQVSKHAATSFERLHAEVELALKVLEATATRQAELKMQTVSGFSRSNVVDRARVPKQGKPGIVMTMFVSALIAILAVLAWYGVEFTTLSSRLATSAGGSAAGGKQSEV